MIRLISVVAIASILAVSVDRVRAAESCATGGVPGLNSVAHRLKVRPAMPSRSALNACDGRAYEIGALLSAALDRIERLERIAPKQPAPSPKIGLVLLPATKEVTDGKR